MSRGYRRWTADDDAALESLRLEGLTARQIAERLGRAYSATRNRLARLGVARPHADSRRLESAAPRGPLAGVAAGLGIALRTVYNTRTRLRRAGWSIPDLRKGPT